MAALPLAYAHLHLPCHLCVESFGGGQRVLGEVHKVLQKQWALLGMQAMHLGIYICALLLTILGASSLKGTIEMGPTKQKRL